MGRIWFVLSLLLLHSCISLTLKYEDEKNDACKKPWLLIKNVASESCVSLPQNTPKKCRENRRQDLEKQRSIYKLTKPLEKTPQHPAKVQDLKYALACPLLDLTAREVLGLAMKDPNQQQWLGLFIYINQRNDNFTSLYKKNPHLFEDINDYIEVYKKALAFQIINPSHNKFFKYPSVEEPFKDIINTAAWEDDDVFTDQRLAGLNVHSIKKVSIGRGWGKRGITWNKLRKKLNKRFNWNKAFSRAVRRPVNKGKMVKQGSVFVVSYSIMKNLPNVPDLSEDPRVLRKSTSPIAVFVSTKNSRRKENKLKPVAIQIDESRDSPVYTPKDGLQWMMAKTALQLADFTYLEMVEHLLKSHFLLESICVTLRRTLSRYHPLMQIMEHHCIGVFVTNGIGLPTLLGPKGTMRQMFSIGDVGGIKLVNRAYAKLSWNDMDFNSEIKNRGVDDKRKLPYYPYRDDGQVIFDLLGKFAKEYVGAFYPRVTHVRYDKELQNFANELSRRGTGDSGGAGKLRGFPSRILSKRVLVRTLHRILWVIVRHHVVNYPVDYYASFVPNMPSKLYDARGAPDYEFSLKRFPNSTHVAAQTALGFSLASLRYDNLFDYSKKLEHKVSGCIVQKYFDKLMSNIKRIIEERNRKRLQAGHLTYPYLQPGWIPNSIHT